MTKQCLHILKGQQKPCPLQQSSTKVSMTTGINRTRNNFICIDLKMFKRDHKPQFKPDRSLFLECLYYKIHRLLLSRMLIQATITRCNNSMIIFLRHMITI